MNGAVVNERFHSLDALRAFALLLGVVYHAAESFMAGHLNWAIVDASPSSTLHLFRHASHAFRLEIFFLMAGFFARLVYHRRGARAFWRNRFSRIFVPLVVGWCVLYPLLVFIWLWGAGVSDNWTRIAVPPEFRSLPTWKLWLGFFANAQFIPMFDLTHLWFLHQLLVIYVLALGLRAALLRWAPELGRTVRRADRALGFVFRSRAGWLLPALATFPLLLCMQDWTVDTPQRSLWPYLPTTLLYGFIFVCGWMLHRQPALIEPPTRRWRACLLWGVVLAWPTEFPFDFARLLGLSGSGLSVLAVRALHDLLYALMMWSFMFGFLGLFVRFASHPSARWRYVADSSYWVYLAHLPLIVALQVWLGPLPWHWSLKFPLIVAIAAPLLFLSYHYGVRGTFIGRQLNGRRLPVGPLFQRRPGPDGARPAPPETEPGV